MDGVLQGAVVLCVCKLACNLLFLPSLTTTHGPVSFCCCCLLVFTDFLVTVFLSFLWISGSWLTDQIPLGDVIALRFLLFLGQMYGGVLLLTTPLIAVETLTRLLWPPSVVSHGKVSHREGSDGQCCYTGEVTVEEEEESNIPNEDQRLFHVISYICCLSVWVIVALNVRWQLKLEEVWATACLHTNSLFRCLPNLLSPMPSALNPCWGMAFLLLLLILAASTGLHRQHHATAKMEMTHSAKHGVNNNGDSYRQDLVPLLPTPSKLVNLGMSVSEAAQRVDPEKTESSCTVHRAYFWNSVQMSACHHGDFVLTSPGCLSAERGGQKHERTKKGIPLTFTTKEKVESQYRSEGGWQEWIFSCLGVKLMIGFVGVLSTFVLPLNLSVNILLIRTIETLLELCLKSTLNPQVRSEAKTNGTSTSHNETLV
ncbi:uncharacterized protein LOC113130993 isoform X2 [Mastacembelus armatus]|nr:uncharacterized protein LOC113130993 isoform X2 [Mastacembelus armatus]XP_026163808.1 uncharacterized protein LOC113130993 isoform X2 [Mastacembelus armatus]